MKNFAGRTAAITGAGGGIGRALAVGLAAAGANLALSDINPAGLADTAALLDGADITVTTTVSTSPTAIRSPPGPRRPPTTSGPCTWCSTTPA